MKAAGLANQSTPSKPIPQLEANTNSRNAGKGSRRETALAPTTSAPFSLFFSVLLDTSGSGFSKHESARDRR
jgi:hypothetical protein